MTVQTRLITAEELEHMSFKDKHVELVRGEIIEMPLAVVEHGDVAGNAFAALHGFVRKHKLGKVYIAETGFVLSHNPDVVRAPDAAFLSAERVSLLKRKEDFIEGAPDLAVEVVSPGDTDTEVQEKVVEYFEAGTRMVLIIRPRLKTITIHRSPTEVRVLTLNDTLDGEDVLPGFSVPVREIFE
jgi:Uma2 family endonuclease